MTPQQVTVGSLFSGIGGIDLGLERAGFEIAWQVEIDPYAQKVLTKHWPHVARYGDIRTVGKHNLAPVDLLAGGFPCQDISIAGKRIGITGERSGLWKEFYRVICELRPHFVLVENVPALLYGGIDTVLGDLAESGYDAEWQIISAEALGAPHLRERVFIVGYSMCVGCGRQGIQHDTRAVASEGSQNVSTMADTESRKRDGSGNTRPGRAKPSNSSKNMADTTCDRRQSRRAECQGQQEQILPEWSGTSLADPDRQGLAVGQVFGSYAATQLTTFKRDCSTGAGQWAVEPNVGRTLDGFSSWLDGHRGLTDEAHKCIMASGINTPLGGIHDATSTRDRARKVLRTLRNTLEAQGVQWETRGLEHVSPSQILLAYVCKLEERNLDETRVQLESEEASQDSMRSLWSGNEPTCSPYRSEQGEQHSREYTDSLQILSRLLARYAEKAWISYRRENATPHWEDGIARVANGVPSRVDRLRGLGNAVVPQVAEYIGRCILDAMKMERAGVA